MKINLESTTKVIEFNGIPARIWEGETENGIKVHAFITRIAVDKNESNLKEFEKQLQECKPPSAEVAEYPFSLRLIT